MNEMQMKQIEKGDVTTPKGFKATGIHCGIRRKKKDLGILFTEAPAVSAAVYTTNKFQAAPLKVTQASLAASKKQKAIIVNSGNANAFTGEEGLKDAYIMRDTVAEQLDLDPEEVMVASTGVIGEKLPMFNILEGIDQIAKQIEHSDGHAFAEAILTTDTVTKSLAVEVMIEGKKVTIGGTAKGSGMIHPNMATMFAFITTDANIEEAALQKLLRQTTDETFNMITVDGDTSTNDMVIVMANGLAENNPLDETHPEWAVFYQGFHYVASELAKMIAKDGEGATKLVTVTVEGAESTEMAKTIAKKIVGSNLVKTAVFGADGNWGRVVMAIGNSGYQVKEENLDITIGNVTVVKQGKQTNYEEQMVTESLQEEEVKIAVHLHLGKESATAWGCDLTYDYVKINASYRT